MKSRRIMDIEEYILNNGTVKIDTLCDVFKVSKNTIRRDINELAERGIIKKVYGGVTAGSKKLIPFNERNSGDNLQKMVIAQAASKFVMDGDIIFIDSGTTTLNVINYLKERSNVTILTANLNAMINALPYANLNIISLGGSLIRKTNSFVGTETISILKNYNINKAFMSSSGVSISRGVTNYLPQEYEIKKAVIEKSDRVYLLVDSSKFNNASLMTYCRLEDIDHVITNEQPSKEYTDFFSRNNIELTIADNA